VLSTSSAFLRFWLSDDCRDALLSRLDREDLPNVRLVCHDFSSRASPYLFSELSVTFKPSTFTKPARMEALERIGRHVKTFTFHMPHGRETFLPPIIDPVTGDEKPFLYEPQVDPPVVVLGKDRCPKYGTTEMTDLLIQQYPPLFHASTNVPAFVRALSSLPFLTHIKIRCPGYSPSLRGHRRTIVDYALISLRIAVERAPLYALTSLSLLPIHPGGLLYLHPLMGSGCSRGPAKRWGQIRNLIVHMEGLPKCPTQETEHFRILHAYLRTLSRSLTHLFFRWNGRRGPSPLSLDTEPQFQPRPPSREEASVHPTLRARDPTALPPLTFPRLKHVEIENAAMDAAQISTFVATHKPSLADFNFKDVKLRSGDWDVALAPLTGFRGTTTGTGAGAETWKSTDAEQATLIEVMECPLVLENGAQQLPRKSSKPDVLPRRRPEPRIHGPLMGEEHAFVANEFPMFVGRSEAAPAPVVRDSGREKDTMITRFLGGSGRRSGEHQHHREPQKLRKKKHEWVGSEGVKRFLRGSGFLWRVGT
jgi:hypothetical protein